MKAKDLGIKKAAILFGMVFVVSGIGCGGGGKSGVDAISRDLPKEIEIMHPDAGGEDINVKTDNREIEFYDVKPEVSDTVEATDAVDVKDTLHRDTRESRDEDSQTMDSKDTQAVDNRDSQTVDSKDSQAVDSQEVETKDTSTVNKYYLTVGHDDTAQHYGYDRTHGYGQLQPNVYDGHDIDAILVNHDSDNVYFYFTPLSQYNDFTKITIDFEGFGPAEFIWKYFGYDSYANKNSALTKFFYEHDGKTIVIDSITPGYQEVNEPDVTEVTEGDVQNLDVVDGQADVVGDAEVRDGMADGMDPCAGVDCSGHGVCVVNNLVAHCKCDDGFHAQGLECIANSSGTNFPLSGEPPKPEAPRWNGTTYYVDPTATGTDDGLTPENAFTSLDELSHLQLKGGDAVLFKKGTTLRGTWNIDSSGSEGNPIVFSSYGTGPRPKIYASEIITPSWTYVGNHVWKMVNPPPNNPHRLYRNGVELMYACDGRDTLGSTVPDTISWFYDGNLYLYSKTDPNGDRFEINLNRYLVGEIDRAWWYFYDLELGGGWDATLYVNGPSHITVSYCTVGHMSHRAIYFESKSRVAKGIVVQNSLILSDYQPDYKEAGVGSYSQRGAREGIFSSGAFDGETIRFNVFQGWQHSAVMGWADPSTWVSRKNTKVLWNRFVGGDLPYGNRLAEAGDTRNYELAYNVFYQMHGGRLQADGSYGHIHHNIFYKLTNSLIDLGEGYGLRMGDWNFKNLPDHSHHHVVENNLFYFCEPGGIDLGGTNNGGVTDSIIRDNIFVGDTRAIYVRANGGNAARTIYLNNIMFNSKNPNDAIYYHGATSVSHFESHLDLGDSASGNISAQPHFVDADHFDFHLAPGSPGLGQGVKPKATKDLDGNTIKSPYNIGPYDEPK